MNYRSCIIWACTFFFLVAAVDAQEKYAQLRNKPIGFEIDESLYTALDLPTDFPSAFFLSHKLQCGDKDILVVSAGCCATSNTVTHVARLLMLDDGQLLDILPFGGSHANFDVQVLHDTFISSLELVEEMGVADKNHNPTHYNRLAGNLAVVVDKKWLPVEDLSKKQLRIYRNLIPARYGYTFKSADLAEYFEKMDWYKPKSGIDPEAHINAHDRLIVQYIRRLEK